MLKALLSDLGTTTPDEFVNPDVLTPFGAVYRYDGYDGTELLNRLETRAMLRSLRAWVEDQMRRRISEAT